MNLLSILIILLLVFGWGGFAVGGPLYAGSGIGLLLLILIVLFLLGKI